MASKRGSVKLNRYLMREIHVNNASSVAARVRSQARACEVCSGQRGTGAGFLRVLRFLPPIRIPPTAPFLLILSLTLYSLDTERR